MPTQYLREFTKGGFSKGGLSNSCVIIMFVLRHPPLLHPPFVNSRVPRGDRHDEAEAQGRAPAALGALGERAREGLRRVSGVGGARRRLAECVYIYIYIYIYRDMYVERERKIDR